MFVLNNMVTQPQTLLLRGGLLKKKNSISNNKLFFFVFSLNLNVLSISTRKCGSSEIAKLKK